MRLLRFLMKFLALITAAAVTMEACTDTRQAASYLGVVGSSPSQECKTKHKLLHPRCLSFTLLFTLFLILFITSGASFILAVRARKAKCVTRSNLFLRYLTFPYTTVSFSVLSFVSYLYVFSCTIFEFPNMLIFATATICECLCHGFGTDVWITGREFKISS